MSVLKVWNGSSWVVTSGGADLSAYYTVDQTVVPQTIQGEVNIQASQPDSFFNLQDTTSYDSSSNVSREAAGIYILSPVDWISAIYAPSATAWQHHCMIRIKTLEEGEVWIPAYKYIGTGGGGGSGSGSGS